VIETEHTHDFKRYICCPFCGKREEDLPDAKTPNKLTEEIKDKANEVVGLLITFPIVLLIGASLIGIPTAIVAFFALLARICN
jgi:hypothetical protein